MSDPADPGAAGSGAAGPGAAGPVDPGRAEALQGLRSVGWMVAGLAVAVIAVSQTDLGAEAVRDLLTRLSPLRLGAALAVMSVGLGFLALRWRSLMPVDTRGIGLPGLTSLLLVGTLLNYALPGPVGEFAAAAMAARRYGIAAEVALAAGIHGRFVGLGVAGTAALLLLALFPMPVPPDYYPWIRLASLAIGAGVILLALLSAYPQGLRALSAATAGRIGPLRPLDASVARFCAALGAVGRLGPRRYALAALWALCGHACVTGGILIAAHGLGSAPHPAGMAFTYAIATAGAVVLYAFPGSQAGWDAMFCALLVATTGVTLADAAALTLIVRVQQLLIVCVGAVTLIAGAGRLDRPGPLSRP